MPLGLFMEKWSLHQPLEITGFDSNCGASNRDLAFSVKSAGFEGGIEHAVYGTAQLIFLR